MKVGKRPLFYASGKSVDGECVEFHLLYSGNELRADSTPSQKHTLRRAFHPQLKQLWKSDSRLSKLAIQRGLYHLPEADQNGSNSAERALRVVTMGRKNCLLAGSDSGGESAAALFPHRFSQTRRARPADLSPSCPQPHRRPSHHAYPNSCPRISPSSHRYIQSRLIVTPRLTL